VSEWVSMEERLPPTQTPILICTHDGRVTAAEFEHHQRMGWVGWSPVAFTGYDVDGEWDVDGLPWEGVTHWMPLPAPPVPRERP
jgi:hypothetical protein